MDFVIQGKDWVDKNCNHSCDEEDGYNEWNFIHEGKRRVMYDEEIGRVVTNAKYTDESSAGKGMFEYTDKDNDIVWIHECFVKRYITKETDGQYYI